MAPAGYELVALGFSPELARAFEPHAGQGLLPALVAAQHTHLYRVLAADGERVAGVSGRFRHEATSVAAFPVVGDWVALAPRPGERRAEIQAVLPRRSRFSRRAAGEDGEEQVVAANVDTVFLIAGLDGDFNLRRIERTLVLAWESGAAPVVVLNKADVCGESEARRAQVEAVAPGVPVHVISSLAGDGLSALAPYLAAGRTVALLGSSGVGKSTLVNRLLGEERQKTRAVRVGDSRGRHTTSHRELLVLPSGGLVIDTPGLRELQLWAVGEGLAGTFEDVAALAEGCAFRDCAHDREPGCAVQAAVEQQRLPAARLASFHKLQRELSSLERRHDPAAQAEERRRWRSIHKSLRHFKPRSAR